MKRIEELTLKLLDDAITEDEVDELKSLVASDPSAAQIHCDLVDQEAVLRGDHKRSDITEATLQTIRETLNDRIKKRVMDKIYKEESKASRAVIRPVESDWRWLGGKLFISVAASILIIITGAIILKSMKVTGLNPDPQEVFLYGQWNLTPGQPAAYRAFVRNGKTGKPIPGANVRFTLASLNDAMVWDQEKVTDVDGIALVETRIFPDLVEGGYSLKVNSTSEYGKSELITKVTIKRSFRVYVTTDKPLYQPGQTIHIRTISMGVADSKPASGQKMTIEVNDPKGNKVFKKILSTSEFGVASADFELADQVNSGEYSITAIMEDTSSKRVVTVKRYQLPKFKVDLTTDNGFYAPGALVRGNISARYTFGEPVAGGKINVKAFEFVDRFSPFAEIEGMPNDDGFFSFELELMDSFVGHDISRGDAFVKLEATVTDLAGHVQKKSLDLTVTMRPIRIEILPESGAIVQNVENIVYIVTSYPDGRPARTKLKIGQTVDEVKTSEMGIASVRITPDGPSIKLSVIAEDASGLRSSVERKFSIDKAEFQHLLRTDRAVYKAGETVTVTVLSEAEKGAIFLDVIKDRRTMLTRKIDIKEQQGGFALDLPPDLTGTLIINAFRIHESGAIVSDSRIIQVMRPDDLNITVKMDKDIYRPAGEAVIDFLVSRSNGEPVQAALGLAGVDEAVFALSDMHPGLISVYFAIQEELLNPRFETHQFTSFTGPNEAYSTEELEQKRQEMEKSSATIFSALGTEIKARQATSESYSYKLEKLNNSKTYYFNDLYALGVIASIAIYILLLIPIIVYSFFRLAKGKQIEGISKFERNKFKTEGWLFTLWCWIGSILLTLITLTTSLLIQLDMKEIYLVVIFVVFLQIVISLWIRKRKLLQNRLATGVPLFRKWVSIIPIAYTFGIAGILLLVNMDLKETRLLDLDTALILMLMMWLISSVSIGAVSASIRTLLGPFNTTLWLQRMATRTAVTALPTGLLIASSLSLSSLNSSDSSVLNMISAQYGPDEKRGPREKKGARGKSGSSSAAETTRVRRYFPETLLWTPELITDDEGKARITLPLADSITRWRISANAVSRMGELGACDKALTVFQDFFVDIDFPPTLTQNDLINLPVAIYNYLDEEQTVTIEVREAPWFTLKDKRPKSITIEKAAVTSVFFEICVLEPGRPSFTVTAHGNKLSDAIERKVFIEPDGRKVPETVNGVLRNDASHVFMIPEYAIDKASDLLVKIYPGAFSQVIEGLDNIFKMPYGCFEQTSSVTYPNILALSYLNATGQSNPAIEMKALNYINLGYQRLISFEVDGGGFDWFGEAPANIVLTAYGLMEFCDMAKLFEVDPKIIERTRNWLYEQQQSNGSWIPSISSSSGGATFSKKGDVLRTTAYTAWAIAEAGDHGEALDTALDFIEQGMTSTEDVYTLALCANALIAGSRMDKAANVLAWLDGFKQKEKETVHWISRSQGVTYSTGTCLDIETTALCAYAYLKSEHNILDANAALEWLIEQKDSLGTWFSTQATVHAMRALLTGSEASKVLEEPAIVSVICNGQIAKEFNITPENADVFHMISLKQKLLNGDNTVSINMTGAGRFAYQITGTYYEPWKENDETALKELSIDIEYDSTTLKTNEILKSTVTISYNRPGSSYMTIVDLGVPPGFELDTDVLDRLKSEKIIEKYSVTGQQAILYFTEIVSGKPISFEMFMRAKYPVKVKTPRSSVYPYYEPGLKDETKPVELKVF